MVDALLAQNVMEWIYSNDLNKVAKASVKKKNCTAAGIHVDQYLLQTW
jgi:hypothetical protein